MLLESGELNPCRNGYGGEGGGGGCSLCFQIFIQNDYYNNLHLGSFGQNKKYQPKTSLAFNDPLMS